MGSAHSAWTTPGLPPLTAHYASPFCTAQAPGCSAGELSKAGPGFCGLPRPKLLGFTFSGTSQRYRPGWACVLCPSQVRAAQATRCLASMLSQVDCVLITSPHPVGFLGVQRERRLRCALCLLWGAGLWLRPFRQMSAFQDPRKTWLATGSLLSLVEDAVSGAEIFPCLPALAVTCLPLCLWWGNGLVCSQLALLWYSLSPLFCEQARLCLRLELFMGQFSLSLSLSFFFLLSLAILQFGLLSHMSSLRLPSVHSGLVLTLSTQPTLPCSASAPWWQTQVSGYFSAGSCS